MKNALVFESYLNEEKEKKKAQGMSTFGAVAPNKVKESLRQHARRCGAWPYSSAYVKSNYK